MGQEALRVVHTYEKTPLSGSFGRLVTVELTPRY